MYSVSRCRKLKGSLNMTGIVILDSSYQEETKTVISKLYTENLSTAALYSVFLKKMQQKTPTQET